jgi:hypothetical protein
MVNNVRSYQEMKRFITHEERFDYLKLRASVGESTFGFDRWINQNFYRSAQWKHTRNVVIARDMGLDMGVEGFEIYDKVIVHHMNPMRPEDIDDGDPDILNPEYLVCVAHRTHNAIYFGDKSLLPQPLIERKPGDTKLW